ncbi:MAG TPA: hypothetical protein ENI80_07310 [Acidiferrobacteraceae bacterium]|nr:hypothetical protein [Acidiferrobacteraceae bacterium]
MKKALLVVFLVFVQSACTATLPTARNGDSKTRLALLDVRNTVKVLEKDSIDSSVEGFNRGKNEALVEICRGPDAPPLLEKGQKGFVAQGLVKVAFDFILKPIVSHMVGDINDRVQSKLDEYIASHDASVLTDRFYTQTDPYLKLGWHCFRFTRKVENDVDGETVLDLLGQFRLSRDRGALLVRPLRFYFNRAQAKGDVVGIAISLKASSVWRNNASRKAEKTFDTVLINEVRSADAPRVSYYFGLNEKEGALPFTPVKLPAWTYKTANKGATGNVLLTVTVAESGNVPDDLALFAKIFDDKKDDLSKLISKAIGATIGAGK